MLVLEVSYINNLQTISDHYRSISKMPAVMKYSLLFAYESIAQNSI